MPTLIAPSGIEWNYDLEGEGRVLLFIHGWGVDRRIWRQQTKFFSQNYKVLAADLPGHGKSTWRKIPLKEMAGDLKFILNTHLIHEFSIIGSSVGGLLALRLYESFPAGIKKLSFVGSIPKFARSEDYPFGIDVTQIRKLGGRLKTAYPSVVSIFFRSLFTREERETRRFKWLQKFRQHDDVPLRDALVEYLGILEAEDLREVLRNINVPVQFINGTHDEICTLKSVEHIKSLKPEARYDYFNKCGHFPFLSKPYEFNSLLEEFLGAP